ncbi:MAG: porin family protein [Bacteroidota bacterium]
MEVIIQGFSISSLTETRTIMRILSLLFFFFVSTMIAQGQVAIGFKGGINLAKWTNIDQLARLDGTYLTDDYLVGLSLGLVAEVELSHNLFLQSELSFVQKGHLPEHLEAPAAPARISTTPKYTLNYLELAVLPKYKRTWDSFGVFVVAGPGIGYLQSGTITLFEDQDGEAVEADELDLPFEDDNFNRFEISMHLGGGFLLPLREDIEMFLDARYVFGLTDVNDESEVGFPRSGTGSVFVQNRGIGISLGALFDI